MVEGVEQHGKQACARALALLALRKAGKLPCKFNVPARAHLLQRGKTAVAGFEQGEQTPGNHLGHLVVRGVGDFLKPQAVVARNAVKLHAFHDVHKGDDCPCSIGPTCPACSVDVAFVILGRFVEEDVGEGWNVYAARCHVGKPCKTPVT